MKRILSLFLIVTLVAGAVRVCTSASDSPALKYVALGDSIPRGYSLDYGSVTPYPSMLASSLGAELSNLAVDGYTSSDLLSLVSSSESARALLSDADIITVSIGGNDIIDNYDEFIFYAIQSFFYGSVQMSDNMKSIYSALSSNIMTIITELRVLNPDAVILFENLYNPYYGIKYSGSYIDISVGELIKPYIDEVNSVYRSCLSSLSALLSGTVPFYSVDVATPMENTQGSFSGVDFHPSPAGHSVIHGVMLAFLNGLGIPSSRTDITGTSQSSSDVSDTDGQTIPVYTSFIQTTSAQTTSAETTSAQTTSTEITSVQTTSTETTSAQTTSTETASVQDTSTQVTSSQTTSAQTVLSQTTRPLTTADTAELIISSSVQTVSATDTKPADTGSGYSQSVPELSTAPSSASGGLPASASDSAGNPRLKNGTGLIIALACMAVLLITVYPAIKKKSRGKTRGTNKKK